MSSVLPNNTPESDVAVASVEDPAPADEMAAVEGSAEEGVSLARFNGLMSAHQKALADMRDLQARQAELEARLHTQQETEPVAEQDEVLAELRATRAELAAERMHSARSRVLEEFPAAKPFADMIVGDTEEDLRSVASMVAQRLASITPEAPVADADGEPEVPAVEDASEEAPSMPVVAGGTQPPSAQDAAADSVSDALTKGDFDAYIEAKLRGVAELS